MIVATNHGAEAGLIPEDPDPGPDLGVEDLDQDLAARDQDPNQMVIVVSQDLHLRASLAVDPEQDLLRLPKLRRSY